MSRSRAVGLVRREYQRGVCVCQCTLRGIMLYPPKMRLSVRPSIRPSVCPSVCPPISPSVSASFSGSILSFYELIFFSNFVYEFISERSGLGLKMGKFRKIAIDLRKDFVSGLYLEHLLTNVLQTV